ncbi:MULTISPECIES: hypothetical protein [Gordonia]|nr:MULTISPECIES: hypothetical protein [Gordonia]NKY93626.1 hypothetical protein [Gordonia sputi]OBA31962.1 hypothetical protein A5766_13025 [Gordonia sp. 852002-51296_SCH5728562-b]
MHQARSRVEFRDFFKAHYGPIIAVYRFIADDATRTAELDTAVSALADEYLIDGRMEWKYLLAVGRRAAPLALS